MDVIGNIYKGNTDPFPYGRCNQSVPLDKFITSIVKANVEHSDLLTILQNHGKDFSDGVWQTFPKNLPTPIKTASHECHLNSVFYAIQLMNYFHGDSTAFKFITGYHGMMSIEKTDDYFISSHSYLWFEGKILDCSLINHPPMGYIVDQYFGVAYDPRIVIKKFKDSLRTRMTKSSLDLFPLWYLKNELCLP